MKPELDDELPKNDKNDDLDLERDLDPSPLASVDFFFFLLRFVSPSSAGSSGCFPVKFLALSASVLEFLSSSLSSLSFVSHFAALFSLVSSSAPSVASDFSVLLGAMLLLALFA